MSKVVSGRVPDELAEAVAAYAERRGVKRGVVVEAALREFLEMAQRGVPDLPQPRRSGRPPKAASSTAGNPVRVDTVSQVHEWQLKRQSRLNAEKERSRR